MTVQLSTTSFADADGIEQTAAVVEFVGERVLDDEHAEARVEERVEREFVEFVRKQSSPPRALILRMDSPLGVWRVRSTRGPQGVDAICVAMVRAQLPTYMALFREGIDAIVHTDLPRDVAGSLQRAGPALARQSVVPTELTPEAWLFQNFSTFLVQPFDLVISRVLPVVAPVLHRRAQYVRGRVSS